WPTCSATLAPTWSPCTSSRSIRWRPPSSGSSGCSPSWGSLHRSMPASEPGGSSTMTDGANGIAEEGRSSVVAVYETDEQARLGFDALRQEGIAEERITVVGAGETEDAAGVFEADSPTAQGAARGALLGG